MTTTLVLDILIVDDNDICADILARKFKLKNILKIANYTITIINSPEKALKNLETNSYDVIFTDIEMPGMTGDVMVQIIRYDLTCKIHGKNRSIPIVAITSKYDRESLLRYRDVGITKSLEKPANTQSIRDIVSEICRQHKRWKKN